MKIYDIPGKEITTLIKERQNTGSYSVVFKGENLPGGIYFCWLVSGNLSVTKRMILLK